MPNNELDLNYLNSLVNNPMPNNPTMTAGRSRFDDEAGFSINPNPEYGSQNIENLNEARAQSQSTLDRVGLMVPRIANKFLSEVAKTPGYVGGMISAMGDKTIGEAMDNAWLNNIDQFSQDFNEDVLKVYVPQAVENGGLWKNVSSASFWATEGADGIGFLTSMMVPGQLLKGLGVGSKIARGLTRLSGSGKLGQTSKIGTSLQKAALWAGKNYDDVQAAGINTMLEASAEAKESFDGTYDTQVNNFLRQHPDLTEEQIPSTIIQDFRNKAGEAASNVFKFNTALLFASNLVDQANIFGAFANKKSLMSNMFDKGKLLSPDQILKSIKLNYKSIGKAVGSGILKEGFGEEGSQFAAGEFYKSEALGEDKYDNIIDTYIDNFDNVDMQKSIFLGGFLGGGMSVVGEVNQAKRDRNSLLGTEGVTRNKFQKIFGMKDKEGEIGLQGALKESLLQRENNIFNAAKRDAEGNLVLDENGKLDVDQDKVDQLIANLGDKITLSQMMDIAAVMGDKEQFTMLKNTFDFSYFLPFFQQGPEGLKLLKEHIKGELAQIEEKKNEVGEKLGLTESPQETAVRLDKKAEEMFKIYESNAELHQYRFPTSLANGDELSYNEFSRSVKSKKLDLALVDYTNTQLIEKLTNQITSITGNTAEDQQKKEMLTKKVQLIANANVEVRADYNNLFEKESLQKQYDNFLIKKKEAAVKAEEAKADPELLKTDEEQYLERLTQAGYDVKASREQPIYFKIGNDGYIANRAIGGKSRKIYNSKTGQVVGEFNLDYFKRNKDKIVFIPKEEAEKLRKRRKIIELRRKQYTALVNIALNTKSEFDTLGKQIEEKTAKREELLAKIEEERKELKKVVNEFGVAKKGYGEIKKLVKAQINELEKEIQSLDEDIEILELYQNDFQETLESVEAYKSELQTMSPDESFFFKAELKELEAFESYPERMDEDAFLNKMITELSSAIANNMDLKEDLMKQRAALKDILDVYNNFYNMSIADKLLINTKISEAKYQALIQKYPFLETYKKAQLMLFYKTKNNTKVKEYDAWKDYNDTRLLKQGLYTNIENFVTSDTISSDAVYKNAASIEEAIELVAGDIVQQLEGLSKISEDIQGIEQHLNEAKDIENEFNIINEEINRLDNAINKAKAEYNNAKALKDITDLSKKKLKFLQDNINEISVQINKISIQNKNANASNTADNNTSDYKQQPPVEEVSSDDFQFRDPFLSNHILRSIFPEVLWDNNGRYIFNEDGSPQLNKKLNIRTISAFLNANKKALREGQYSVKFYLPNDSKTPKDIDDLFKSEYPEASSEDIGFVIVDKNGQPVKQDLDGVKRIVYGFLPKSMKQETSSNKLRINDNAVLQKFLASKDIFIADPIKVLKTDASGNITNESIVTAFGKITLDGLKTLSKNWVDDYYQNSIKKAIFDHIAKYDNTQLDIIGVTQGLMLKSNKLKDVQSVFGEGKVKIISLEDSTDKELGGFRPGTVVYESEGEKFPVIQRTLTTEEIETVMSSIYLGWIDSKSGPFAAQAEEFGKTPDGKSKYVFIKGKEQYSYRYYPGANSNISILTSLIYWGQYKRDFYLGQDGEKIPVAGKHKGEIFVESGILYFKDPNNGFETLTGVNLEELGVALGNGTAFTSTKFQPLIKFLANKRLNVNKELLSNRGLFFYPTVKIKDGKVITTYETFANYEQFLLKGKSNAPKVLSTSATSKNTANRQLIFDTDLKDSPRLYSEKKTPKKQTPKKISNLATEVQNSNVDIDALNDTSFGDLPDGDYIISVNKEDEVTEVNISKRDGVFSSTEASNSNLVAGLNSKGQATYSFNILEEVVENSGMPGTIRKISGFTPVKVESDENQELLDEVDELLAGENTTTKLNNLKALINKTKDLSTIMDDIFKILDEDEYTTWQETLTEEEFTADLKDPLGKATSEEEVANIISKYLIPKFIDKLLAEETPSTDTTTELDRLNTEMLRLVDMRSNDKVVRQAIIDSNNKKITLEELDAVKKKWDDENGLTAVTQAYDAEKRKQSPAPSTLTTQVSEIQKRKEEELNNRKEIFTKALSKDKVNPEENILKNDSIFTRDGKITEVGFRKIDKKSNSFFIFKYNSIIDEINARYNAELVAEYRRQEQEEIKAKIPNAKFKADGKIDESKSSKVDVSIYNNIIYPKYDKLISPLLGNNATPTTKADIEKRRQEEYNTQYNALVSGQVLDNSGDPVYEEDKGIGANSLSTLTDKEYGHGHVRTSGLDSLKVLESLLDGSDFSGMFGKIGTGEYSTWESGKFIIVSNNINPTTNNKLNLNEVEIILNAGLSPFAQELANKYPNVIFKDFNGKQYNAKSAPTNIVESGTTSSDFEIDPDSITIDGDDRIVSKKEYTIADMVKEKQWLKDKLGLTDDQIESVSGLIDGYSMGRFLSDGRILLSEIMEVGTAYHEAFHRVFQGSLNNRKRRALIAEFKTQPNWESKLLDEYKHLPIDRQIEEVLAEEFRDYVLAEGQKISEPAKQNFFQWLFDLIKKFLKLDTLTKEQLFDKINNGDFKSIKTKNTTYTQSDRVSKIGGIELTPNEKSELFSSMNYYFFDGIFKVHENNSENYFSTKIDVKELYNTYVKNYVISDLKDAVKAFEARKQKAIQAKNQDLISALDFKIKRMNKLADEVENNFNDLNLEFSKQLEYFGLKTSFEKQIVEDSLSSEDNLVDNPETEEKSTGRTLDIISAVEFNTKDNLPNNFKMLIAALPDVDDSGAKKLSPTLGLAQQANWGESVNILLNNVAGTPANIDFMIEKIQKLAEKFPRYKTLIEYIGGDSKTFMSSKGFTNMNLVMLRREVVSALAKTKYNFILGRIDERGNHIFQNANSEQVKDREIAQAKSSIKQIFTGLGGKSNYQNKLNKAFLEKDYVEGARLLGLTIKEQDLSKEISGESITTVLKKIYKLMSNNLNSDKFVVDAIYESKNEFAARKRIKDIVNATFDLDENIELQLVNGEGKSVYSISLNTYQTLLVDEINFWIEKGKTKEERLSLLSKNIPHLINVHNQNSKWLDHLLEGNKLVYHLSDSIKNADELQGQHLSDITPTDLMSYTINSTLSGYFISNKHADRSMFPTYVFESGWDPIGYDNEAIPTATDIMLGYLKDEVAKVQSLKRNPFYQDVKYYGKFDFKKSLFNGIIEEKLFNKLVNGDIEITHAGLSNQIKKFLTSVVEKDKAKIEELGLLESYSNNFFNKKHIGISDTITPFGFENVKTKERYGNIDKLLEHFSMMSYINHLEEFKIFNGDFSIYKDTADLNKRLNMQSSSGESLSVDNEINTYIANLNLESTLKINGEEFIYKDGDANGQAREVIIADFETVSSVINEIAEVYRKDLAKRVAPDKVEEEVGFLIKAFENMVENDGLSYANIFSNREFSIRASLWNDKLQNNFDLQLAYINKDEAKIKELTTVPEGQDPVKWFSENFEPFVNLKPQYLGPNYIVDKESFTNLEREDRHNVLAGRKTSYHPLIPMEIQGKVLEAMNLFMLTNGIDFIHLGGAAKFGTKIQRPYYNVENGKTKGFNNFELKENEIGYLDYKYMKNQVRISSENKDNITSSSQGRINLVEGLINDGVPIDYINGKDKWDALSEDQKLTTSNIFRSLKEYENIQFALINSSINDLLEEISAIKVSDAYLIEDIEKFKKLLTKLATDKNSPDNIIDILEDFANTNSFLEILPNSSKIQNILFSLITKRVIVEKRPGDMLPQAASTGYENVLDAEGNPIERTVMADGRFISNDDALKFFTFEKDSDGNLIKVLPPEIIIPLPVKLINDLLKKYKTRNIIEAVDLFNKDIASGVAEVKVKGLRIPNQQLSNNDIFKIKKFGYPYLQGNIIVPTELVGKTGGDFDIDKVSVYYPNLDENLQKIKYYSTHTEELFTEFLKNNKKEIYDEIESDKNFKSFVSRLNNLKDRLKSLDNKEINDAIIEYAKSFTGLETKNAFEALDSLKELKKSNVNRISEVSEILDAVYRKKIDTAIQENVYREDFESLRAEKKSLQEQNKLIQVQIDNFYEGIDTTKKDKSEAEKRKESAVKALRTRKANIREEFREEFLATPVNDINSKKALQNRMLEIEEAIMFAPENLRNLLSPVSDNELKTIAASYTKSEKPLPSEIPSASFNVDATTRFLAGKAGVGILATWITFNSKSQINNLKLAPTFVGLDEEGTVYPTALPAFLNVKDNTIGKIYNSFGTAVANALSAILTSQVDLVKDPYAKDITLTEQTLNVVSYLLVRGVELKKIVEFINQPIIIKYLANQKLNESNVFQLTGRESNFNPLGLVLSKNGLIEKTAKQFPKQPIQQKYLEDFILVVEQSKAIGKVKNYMSPDTRTLKDKNDFKLYEKLKTEVATQGIIKNLDDVFEDGKLLAGFKKGKELYMELYKQFFFTEKPEIVNSLDAFKGMLLKNIKGDDLKNKLSNTIDENLITYLAQSSPMFKNQFEKLMQSDKSLAKTLYKIKNNEHSKSKQLKNNILIKALIPLIENKNDTGVALDNVKLMKSKMITFETNNMLDAFEKIMSIDSNLANDIVLFNILQSGFTNSPYQLQSVIPYNSLYKDIIADINNKIKQTGSYDELLQQYFKDFLASHVKYVPTQTQFRSKNYSGYPFYKIKKGDSWLLTDGVNEFTSTGNVFGINYNNHVLTSDVQNNEPRITPAVTKVMSGNIDFQEEQTTGYTNRTIKNASADATIAIAVDFNSAGERLTKSSVLNQRKKYIPIDFTRLDLALDKEVAKIVEELNAVNAKTLNIAGNGIYTFNQKGFDENQNDLDNLVYNMLNKVVNSPNLKTKIESIRTGGQTGFDEAGAKAGIKLGIPTMILAPKGWTFRDITGKDISNEKQFKARFQEVLSKPANPLSEIDVVKNEIKEYITMLPKEEQEKAKDIIRNFGPLKTISDYGRLKDKLCK